MELEILQGQAPQIIEGDLLLGLGSGGIRFDTGSADWRPDDALLNTHIPELGCTVGQEMGKPMRNYASLLDALSRRGVPPKAWALVTGSLKRTLPAILPPGLTARIDTTSIPIPVLFDYVARHCQLSIQQMFRLFNMGIDMVLVVSREMVGQVKNTLCCCGERAYLIGAVVRGGPEIELIF